jgi:hypothetical protein
MFNLGHGYFIASEIQIVNSFDRGDKPVPMNEVEKTEILKKAQVWFREKIATNHIVNTEKLANPAEFNINPFLATYLANFLEGKSSPESIAKALIYPRVLGTSITTSFGANIQRFSSEVLSSYGSAIPGIDLEFVDQIDQQKKYCQLKAGPNTINKDDVESIRGHFGAAIRLARTNNLRVATDDFMVGVLYGSESELSGHYLRITNQYHHPVYVGAEFWIRLTGHKDFYKDLIAAIAEVAECANCTALLEDVITRLANSREIQDLANSIR